MAQQINSLPEVKDLKLADKTAVEAARKAYDALSDNQKAMIEDAKKALEEREAEIKRLEELANNTDKPDPGNKDDKKDDNKDNNKDNNTSTTDKNNNKGSGTTTGTTNKGSNTTTGTATNKGTQSGSTNKTTGTQAQTSSSQTTGSSSAKSAKTGDETDFLLPMAGLISASGVFAGVVLYYKKRRKDTGVEKKEEK